MSREELHDSSAAGDTNSSAPGRGAVTARHTNFSAGGPPAVGWHVTWAFRLSPNVSFARCWSRSDPI
jgi:hypothetical protein